MVSPVHVLVVEDDTAVAHSLQDGLARDGYAVTWKSSGGDGVAFARENHPYSRGDGPGEPGGG
jgi:DNA-binding response OmpR family regulator